MPIEHCLPAQRGNVSMTNLQVVNAILYVAEHGCKWRGLPKRFGNWHTVYTYKRRNEVERLFRRLKGYRRIFSRFDKLDVMFLGFLSFVLVVDGLRMC
ncbi:transposase [Xanthomonas hortorum]